MKKQYFLLFLTSLIIVGAYEGRAAGFFKKNPKIVKALKIGGGITAATLFSVFLWKKSFKEKGVQILGSYNDKRFKCQGQWLYEFQTICKRYTSDMLLKFSPVSDVIISNRDIDTARSQFQNSVRECVVYFLTYKPVAISSLMYHPLVLKEARRNKDKNFYLGWTWYGYGQAALEDYRECVVNHLNHGCQDQREFSQMVKNLYECGFDNLPIKKENIQFITLSDEVLSLEEMYDLIKDSPELK